MGRPTGREDALILKIKLSVGGGGKFGRDRPLARSSIRSPGTGLDYPPSSPHPDAGRFLDQKAVHERYNEGDFESVIQTLEYFRKANPSCSRSDSIFIAKHLVTAKPDR